ncbi:MAG: chemotaxis protein CheW [Desulfobacterales bacterium]|nr:chemotaxis protein CheW [Desulfobacterales bacterium]
MAHNNDKNLNQELEFSTFKISGVDCGINILKIREINKHFEITKVPHAEPYIRGILNLRGNIVTVVDLGEKLGLTAVERHKDNRNLIVDFEDEPIGLSVERIGDFVKADPKDIDPPPSNINQVDGKYFQGVLKTGDQLIGILDIDQVLNTE